MLNLIPKLVMKKKQIFMFFLQLDAILAFEIGFTHFVFTFLVSCQHLGRDKLTCHVMVKPKVKKKLLS